MNNPNTPSAPSNSSNPASPQSEKVTFWQRSASILGPVLSKLKYLFTFAAVTLAITWSIASIYGPKIVHLGAWDITWAVIIAFNGVLELLKVLNVKKTTMPVFIADHFTGMLEYSIVLLTIGWLIDHGRYDMKLLSNWVMILFVLMETFFVTYCRHLMSQRTFSDARSHTDSLHHDDAATLH